MHLSPKETDRLILFAAAELARKRRAKGLKLNYPEARALIADEVLEGAREGKTVAQLMQECAEILTTDDVVPGTAELVGILQVEAMFPDGQKLVTIHEPIHAGKDETDYVVPGEVWTPEGEIELSPGRERGSVTVTNAGDRPIQVGSHLHFFEANKELDFDRAATFGMHLDIPAGTAVRFEPGDTKEVALVTFGGTREVHGLNDLTNGSTTDEATREAALGRARERGYRGA